MVSWQKQQTKSTGPSCPTVPAYGDTVGPAWLQSYAVPNDPLQRVRRWRPIEPELTNFHDIISLTFDIATDRGTSDRYRPFTEKLPGTPWPWQRAVLTFQGGPHDGIVPVRCTFDGLVQFEFLQDDFLPKMGDPGPWRDSYDVAALQGVAGFYIQEPEDDSYGAFCLWECENSPLIEDLTARWNNRPSDEGRTLLRHFETSCDELGLFQFVAGDVTVEVLDS